MVLAHPDHLLAGTRAGTIQTFFNLNPLVPFLGAFRTVVLDFELPSLIDLATLIAVAVTVMLAGYAGFLRAERRFAEFV